MRRREPHRRDPSQRSRALAQCAHGALLARGVSVAVVDLFERPFQDLIDAMNWARLGRPRALMPAWLAALAPPPREAP